MKLLYMGTLMGYDVGVYDIAHTGILKEWCLRGYQSADISRPNRKTRI